MPFYFSLFIIISNLFLDHLNNTFETTLSCTLVVARNYYVYYQSTQAGSRPIVTSKMELFVTIFDSLHSLTIARKIFILDVAGVLDPTLIKDIFAWQDWILTYLFKNLTVFWCFQSIEKDGSNGLISLKPIFF